MKTPYAGAEGMGRTLLTKEISGDDYYQTSQAFFYKIVTSLLGTQILLYVNKESCVKISILLFFFSNN